MAQITIWGDFKTNSCEGLKMSDELISLLNESNINVLNFEAPIHSKGKPIRKSGPNISQGIEHLEWLKKRNFTAVSLANNHILDYGDEGLLETQHHLGSMIGMGAGTWEEAYKMHTFKTSDNLSVGIICCTHCEFGTLADTYLDKDKKGAAHILNKLIIDKISSGAKKVDFLIVMPHAGVEYMNYPLPEWRYIYKQFIDMGADAVVASHPHVPQGWESYKGKPICYSLGNFCFDAFDEKNAPERWYESLCCVLHVLAPHHSEIEMRPVIYNQKNRCITGNTSIEFKKHIQKLNGGLRNDAIYIQYVNDFVSKLLPFYMEQFSRGGLVHSFFSKGFLKGFIEGLRGHGFWGFQHAFNNIQCESHRWAILRAIKLKTGLGF